MKQHHQKQLVEVGEKVLAVIAKYKESQLPFFDDFQVFDPRQRDSIPHNLQCYPNLLSPELQKL
jgi:hypothetical protein